MAEDEIRLDTSMDGELEAALARLEQRIVSVEGKLGDLKRAGKRAGEGVEEGLDSATRATDRTRRSSERAIPPVRQLGDETLKTGTKARVGASGIDEFAKKVDKASRRTAGLRGILRTFKWAGIVSGVFALAGGLSALGAGAAIAVGGLSPMVAVLAAVPTLLLAVKLSMLAVKLAAAQLEPQLTRIKNQFTELGPTIAAGGLGSGLDYFADSLTRLSAVTGTGLSGLGAEIGLAARNAGDLTRSRPFLDQVSAIFAGLRPIARSLLAGLLALGRALLNIVQGSLPMVQEMANAFRDAMESLANWTAETLANGRMTAWLMKGYTIFTRTVGVLADWLMGLFNIMRIGAGYASEMGASIEQSAAQFRLWTESAEGQARINQYFVDSLPALREMGRLLGIILGGLGGLGANQNVAPLIAQINDELAPAIGRLVANFTASDGLGPAIISATAAMADLFATMDFTALVLFAEAVATVARGLIWLGQNVPGAGFAISLLLSTFLGFKLLGPVFALIAGGVKAFAWIKGAVTLTGQLSVMQKLLGGIILPTLRTFATFLWTTMVGAITAVGTALKAAFVTSPIGWIILAIIALVAGFIWLWNNVEGFRNFFISAWEWIKNAAIVTWEWIKNAAVTAFRAVIDAVLWVRDRAVDVWSFLVSAWTAVVNTIVAVAMWIWDHGVKQVLNFIVTAFQVQFAIVKFIVQTVIFFIVGAIWLLAKAAEWVWQRIRDGWDWLWNGYIAPAIAWLRQTWDDLVTAISTAWNWLMTGLSVAWNFFWTTYVAPAITGFQTAWNWLTSLISEAWNWLMNSIGAAWNYLWVTYIGPGIEGIRQGWQNLTGWISEGWNWVTGIIGAGWDWISGKAQGVMDWVSKAWSTFTTGLADFFRPFGEGVSKIFDGIGNAATIAADTAKGAWNGLMDILKGVWNFLAGAWNGIPSITVPDWVPGIGGTTFALPKLPLLYAGGPTPGGPAMVGEHGPETLVRNGRVVGTLGARGPEIVPSLPRGGYVVPNLRTMAAGLARPLPAPVAAAVARSQPAYASAGASYDPGLRAAVRELSAAIRSQTPPLAVSGGEDTRAAVLDALRTFRREEAARGAYDYVAGRG